MGELRTNVTVNGIDDNTPIRHERIGGKAGQFYTLFIGGKITLIFEGVGSESLTNFLSFCDDVAREAEMVRADMKEKRSPLLAAARHMAIQVDETPMTPEEYLEWSQEDSI